MPIRESEPQPMACARVAGLLYLVIIVCGIFAEVGVRSSLLVAGDAGATAANALASPGLFRAGFVADSFMLLSDVALAVLLYALFRPVNPTLSLTAAAFRLTQAAVLGCSLLLYYAASLVLRGEAYGAVLAPGQAHTLALLFLDMHGHGYDLGLVFFAFSNLVLGALVIASRRFPPILGYGLQAAAVVYLTGSYVRFLVPEYLPVIEPAYIVPLAAELAFCVWLLVKGPRPTS